MYNVVKENVESTKLFAILPDSTDYSGINLLPQISWSLFFIKSVLSFIMHISGQ